MSPDEKERPIWLEMEQDLISLYFKDYIRQMCIIERWNIARRIFIHTYMLSVVPKIFSADGIADRIKKQNKNRFIDILFYNLFGKTYVRTYIWVFSEKWK